MKKITYITLALAIGSVISCSKQDPRADKVTGGEIRFSAGFRPELLSKAGEPADEDLNEFSVYGWNSGETLWEKLTSLGTSIFANIKTVKSSDAFVTVGDKKYWTSGNYHFVAYAPYKETSPASFTGYGNSFALKFENYTTSSSLDDLVYSDFATDKRNSDGVVNLKFHHALSKILFKFAVADGSKMVDNSDSKITLVEIKPVSIDLGGFYKKATFTYNGTAASWTTPTDKGAITNSAVVKSTTGYDVYVLPQTLTSDASFTLTYNIVYHSSDTEVTAGPFTTPAPIKLLEGTGGTWTALEMGKQYTVKVNVNAFGGPIEIDPVVEEAWLNDMGTIETK